MQGRGCERNVGWSEDVEGVGGLKTQGLCRTRGSQRAHGDGKTVATQTATQVPLTLSRPFLLF